MVDGLCELGKQYIFEKKRKRFTQLKPFAPIRVHGLGKKNRHGGSRRSKNKQKSTGNEQFGKALPNPFACTQQFTHQRDKKFSTKMPYFPDGGKIAGRTKRTNNDGSTCNFGMQRLCMSTAILYRKKNKCRGLSRKKLEGKTFSQTRNNLIAKEETLTVEKPIVQTNSCQSTSTFIQSHGIV